MLDEFIARTSTGLRHAGYLIETSPRIPGVQASLYARSPQRVRLGAARVEDHFLFVDWGNSAFGRLDQLLEIYRRFSRFANQGFRTPHMLRLQIPNIAVVAISKTDFPDEAVRYARTNSLNPWYGGEVGQVILVEIENQQVISLNSLSYGRHPRPGAFALGHAADILQRVCHQAFQGESGDGENEQ